MLANTSDKLLADVDSLPLDLKTQLIDKLLTSINTIDKKVEDAWIDEVNRRVASIKSGEVTLVDGDEVFKKIKERLVK